MSDVDEIKPEKEEKNEVVNDNPKKDKVKGGKKK